MRIFVVVDVHSFFLFVSFQISKFVAEGSSQNIQSCLNKEPSLTDLSRRQMKTACRPSGACLSSLAFPAFTSQSVRLRPLWLDMLGYSLPPLPGLGLSGTIFISFAVLYSLFQAYEKLNSPDAHRLSLLLTLSPTRQRRFGRCRECQMV